MTRLFTSKSSLSLFYFSQKYRVLQFKVDQFMQNQIINTTSLGNLSRLLLICLLFQGITHSAFPQNVEREQQMGKEAREQLEQQIGFYDHQSESYVDAMGQRMVNHLEDRVFDYSFGILDMKEPNALALPGGEIYFSRGILLLANSEDELGGVLGHEIIHVYKSHSRKASNRSIWTGILKVPGAIVGAFSPMAGGILMAPFTLFDAGYSRKHEKQADELGAKLAAETGYNPNGLISALEKIAKFVELETGLEEQRSFFSTHPYTPKRLEDLEKVIKKIDIEEDDEIAVDQSTFLQSLEGLVIGDNPANGIFTDSLFLHPELDMSIAFPTGWEGINTPVFVGIVSPDQNAQLLVTLDDTIQSPTETAQKFAREYYRYSGHHPDQDESLEINGFPSHLLSYEGYSNGERIVLSFIWMKRKDYHYRFASLSTDRYSGIIRELAESLHKLTDGELRMIKIKKLRIARAKEGETLELLSKRTENILSLEFTALINDMDKKDVLTEGQLVKIGFESNY
jgi:predicted Zn-dependent protease